MTKRALIVIAVLIILPVIVTGVMWIRFRRDNPVVAAYAGNVRTVEYDGKTLYAVADEESYTFRYGRYLGKIGDSTTGASLYLVDDDEAGYYAVADGERNLLFTESGKLLDGNKHDGSVITRVIFNNYTFCADVPSEVSLLRRMPEEEKTPFDIKLSDYIDKDDNLLYKTYKIRVSYDGSAIVTDGFGTLYYLTETKKWIYVSPEAYEAAIEEYGNSKSKHVYHAVSIEGFALLSLLKPIVTPAK